MAIYGLFQGLERFNIVLATGPQRSGTTICAEMIAHDLPKFAMVREERFNVFDLVMFCDMVATSSRKVIQCPSMCRFVHWFGQRDDVAVVMMIRDMREILASQQRIEWEEDFELARYNTTSGPIAGVKYGYWHSYQKNFVKNKFEINYKDLRGHVLWVPKEQRAGFLARQTRLEG